MEGQPRPPSNESAPQSAETVLSVSAAVEKQLRELIKGQATRQAAERKHRADELTKVGKKPENEKKGWAEPLQKIIRDHIAEVMNDEGLQDEDWTLSHPVVARILQGIVERGKIRNGGVPADYRQKVAEFCKSKGEDPEATARSLGLLWASRLLGYSKKPVGQELDPETMQFLAGLKYEFDNVKGGRYTNQTEGGKVQRGPKQIAARLESRTPAIRESAMNEFDSRLDRWILAPPKQQEARLEHFADVEAVIGVAERVMDTIPSMTQERKTNLAGRMQTAAESIASKRSGEARIRKT